MELPYPAPAVSWTRYNHPCLTSRPFLAAHRSRYDVVRRIYPVHQLAEWIFHPSAEHVHPRKSLYEWHEQKSVADTLREHPQSAGDSSDYAEKTRKYCSRMRRIRYASQRRHRSLQQRKLHKKVEPKHFGVTGLGSVPNARKNNGLYEVDDDFQDELRTKQNEEQVVYQVYSRQRDTWDESRRSHSIAPVCIPENLLDSTICQEVAESSQTWDLESSKRQRSGIYSKSSHGNTACTVRIVDEYYTALTSSGYLGELSLFKAHLGSNEDGETHQYHRVGVQLNSKLSLLSDDRLIYEVVGCDVDSSSSSASLFLVRFSDSFSIGTVHCDNLALAWRENVVLPSVRAIAPNRVSGEEVTALDDTSVNVYDIASDMFTSKIRYSSDIQPLRLSSRYWWVHYGAHPRTLLLASSSRLGFVDLRAMNKAEAITSLLDVYPHWRIPVQDDGVRFFSTHPVLPFQNVLATSTLLAIYDTRTLRQPLLEWNLDGSPGALCGALTCLRRPEDIAWGGELVIALSSAEFGELHVFHVTGDGHFSSGLGSPVSTTPPVSDFSLRHPEFLWSDMPLSQLDRFSARRELRGIALVPHHRLNRLSLVQTSKSGGGIAQLLGCEPIREGDTKFNVQTSYDQTPSNELHSRNMTGLSRIDSFANVLNMRDSLNAMARMDACPETSHGLEQVLYRDRQPGQFLQSNLMCIPAAQMVHCRDRIFKSTCLETGPGHSSVFSKANSNDLSSGSKVSVVCSDDRQESRARIGGTKWRSGENFSFSQHVEPSQWILPSEDSRLGKQKEFETIGAGIPLSQDSQDGEELAKTLVKKLDTGKTMDEIVKMAEELASSGDALNIHELEGLIQDSPTVESYEVRLPEDFVPTYNLDRASWLATQIYVNNAKLMEDNDALPSLPEKSVFGLLLSKMRKNYEDMVKNA